MKITIEIDQPADSLAIPASIPAQPYVRATSDVQSQALAPSQPGGALDAGASRVRVISLEANAPAAALPPSGLNGEELVMSAGTAKH